MSRHIDLVTRTIRLHGSAGSEMTIFMYSVPNPGSPDGEMRTLALPAGPRCDEGRSATVEVFRPRSIGLTYGVLAGEFYPLRKQACELEVMVIDATSGPLGTRQDAGEVSVGLPSEYAESVLDGAKVAAQVLGAGVVRFGWGAYSREGSSRTMFRRLATLLVHLMAMDGTSPEQFANVIRTYGDFSDTSTQSN
jgi:hypothetical protein